MTITCPLCGEAFDGPEDRESDVAAAMTDHLDEHAEPTS